MVYSIFRQMFIRVFRPVNGLRFSSNNRIFHTVLVFGLLLGSLLLWGCDSDRDTDPIIMYPEDETPPAEPRGVYSITGDQEVYVRWYPNREDDLDGYGIWRSFDDQNFDLIAEVGPDVDEYIDQDVRNGKTYFYAVTAFDTSGNESELSPESVPDTPRPEGRNITLEDFDLRPTRSGFDFSRPERGAIAWDDPDTDIYLDIDSDTGFAYLRSDNDTLLQDMGFHDSLDELDVAPERGYTVIEVELIEGHIYVFWTLDDHYAKIHVTKLTDTSATLDWAYQVDPENPQLAPALLKQEHE